MDFSEKIGELAKKVRLLGDNLKTEEATKNALIMPFIAALGYDVFDPSEVVPEFSAPIGEYKDARVDYAIMSEGEPILIIECKAFGTPLDMKHCNQLQIYFHGTTAPIAILTDGNVYRFYSDLETANKMDTRPYMEFTLSNMDEALIPELRKLAKGKFDREACMSSANELKYNREFKRIMAEQLENPHDDFVRFFIRQAYDGQVTQSVRERFTPVLTAALQQFINDRINDRLKSALGQQQQKVELEPETAPAIEQPIEPESRIVTTEIEKEAFYLVKSLLVGTVDNPDRIILNDTMNYCAVVLDSRWNPICRLYLNGKQWRIGMYDGENKDAKEDIASLNDIFPLADRLRATVAKYEAAKA